MEQIETAKQFLELGKFLAGVEFRPFTEGDWQAYAGCETATPMIGTGTWRGKEVVAVLDGSSIQLDAEDGNSEMYIFIITHVSG